MASTVGALSSVVCTASLMHSAKSLYSGDILQHYLECFEEIITIPVLTTYLADNIQKNYLTAMVDELIEQCKVEYNFKET